MKALLATILTLPLLAPATIGAGRQSPSNAVGDETQQLELARQAAAIDVLNDRGLAGTKELSGTEATAVAALNEMSEAQARNLLVAQRAIMEWQERQQDQWPDAYAGFIVDDQLPTMIRIGWIGDTAAGEQWLRDTSYPFPETVAFFQAEHSYNELSARRDALAADWRDLTSEGVGMVYTDIEANSIVALVEPGQSDAVDHLRREVPDELLDVRLGVVTEDEQGIPAYGHHCSAVFHHCNPIRGGMTLHFAGQSQTTARCTIGYTANEKVGGALRAITAGHCPNTLIQHSGANIGGVVTDRPYGAADAQAMEVLNGWGISNLLIHTAAVDDYYIDRTSGVVDLAPGITLCYTGARSGHDCFKVKQGRGDANGNTDLLLMNTCTTQEGDSGGPWYAAHAGYAMHEGRRFFQGSCVGATASYLAHVQNALGVNIRTF